MTNQESSHSNIEAQELIHTSGTETQEHTETEGHAISLKAETIFNIGNFGVTNSLLTSWVAVFIILILALAIRLRLSKIPSVFQTVFEKMIEGAFSLMDLVTNDRRKSEKLFPLIFCVFIFILVNNWIGILPGIGSISYHGHHIFRGGTADLNMTLALGLFSVIAANITGIFVVGGWNYLNKFVNLKSLWEIPFQIKKDPTIILVNIIHFFVGLIEVIGEMAKVASLSLRLFGNVFAGEVLLASIAAIMAYGVPLPFIFLEILVGILQAVIFSTLTLVYFSIATTDHAHEH